jgi:DNA adenine methylase
LAVSLPKISQAMQLTLENLYHTYYPPKSQLLKWVGNKQKFAAEITRYFPTQYGRFFEPFLGSGAILATVAPKNGLGSDTFGPLMEIWKTLKSNPDRLIDWYGERQRMIGQQTKEEVYEQVKASYNAQPNGADFLFLSRSCYGGIIRFRKNDGFMSTPCGVHDPISTESFSKRVNEWKNRLRYVNFEHCDYKMAFEEAKEGDMIYCDPPYAFNKYPIKYRRDTKKYDVFDNDKFWEVMREWSKENMVVISEITAPPDFINIWEQERYRSAAQSKKTRFNKNSAVASNTHNTEKLFVHESIAKILLPLLKNLPDVDVSKK